MADKFDNIPTTSDEFVVTAVAKTTYTVTIEATPSDIFGMYKAIHIVNEMMPEPLESLVRLQETLSAVYSHDVRGRIL